MSKKGRFGVPNRACSIPRKYLGLARKGRFGLPRPSPRFSDACNAQNGRLGLKLAEMLKKIFWGS